MPSRDTARCNSAWLEPTSRKLPSAATPNCLQALRLKSRDSTASAGISWNYREPWPTPHNNAHYSIPPCRPVGTSCCFRVTKCKHVISGNGGPAQPCGLELMLRETRTDSTKKIWHHMARYLHSAQSRTHTRVLRTQSAGLDSHRGLQLALRCVV